MTDNTQGDATDANGGNPPEGKAILQALAAVGAGVGNNYCFKQLALLPASEVAVLRSALLLVLLAPGVFLSGRRQRVSLLELPIVARSLAEATATIFLLVSLAGLSVATVATFLMTIPLLATVAGAGFFEEKLGWRGGAFVALGFFGAALALGPIFESEPYYLAAAAFSAAMYTLRDVITRVWAQRGSPSHLAVGANLATLLVAAGLATTQAWHPLTIGQSGLLVIGVGLFLASNLLIIASTRNGRIAIIATTRYSAILWALAVDWIGYGLVPPTHTLIGAAIIVVAGFGLALHK
ncbi:drug/metabolite transporter (DMT)-like permease [Aminobacter lissarensis]|uniref:Drug/metabolite transporter (DMT)-like permease n=1 Tax=Aminobacter carboxidus TaxID=376165 RepID=A0A8E1WLQ6_9HYPH|nr:DMT family transporter [Aminobacter lissarensis]MBB6469820.1 drug/metabolite transporter (DMT)-like permease [Aminobacter lissarensis]